MEMLLSRTEVMQLIEDLEEIRVAIKDYAMENYTDFLESEDEDDVFDNQPIDRALSDLYEIVERLDEKLGEKKDETSKQNATAFGEVICGVESQSQSEVGATLAEREPSLWDLLRRR